MSSNINYSITGEDGLLVMRSTVKSFNLDHVTDKDIVSFYRNFSAYAMFDTGLMPLSGTGVLAIRNAGNHTQITFQHEPQINHINWGATEGDRDAKTYVVAQPYRIWIGDLIDGDLYGARMFYSPYPITSPDQPLYHLNLPNTNCKGYRGNGVGWQCLYHKDSWQGLPFNEKIVRFAERCSGVETYNDANMSETDGPRFYKENDMPEYLWNPSVWETKTSEEGLSWVLDSDNWIPILVKSQDNQGSHDENGIPLTVQMAILGDYQAYYTDNYRPKPINSLSRSDLKLDPKNITTWISRSHSASSLSDDSFDQMEQAKLIRLQTTTTQVKPGGFDIDDEDEEEQENHITVKCPVDGSSCTMHEEETFSDSAGDTYCENCFHENVAFCENTDEYIPVNDPKVKWIDNLGVHINIEHATVKECANCQSEYWIDKNDNTFSTSDIFVSSEGVEICRTCISSFAANNYNPDTELMPDGSKVSNCYGCSATVFVGEKWSHIFPSPKTIVINSDADLDPTLADVSVSQVTFCSSCSTKHRLCPTGHYSTNWSNPITLLPKQFNIPVLNPNTDEIIETALTHLCYNCIDEDLKKIDGNSEALANVTNPFSNSALSMKRYALSVIEGIAFSSSGCTNINDPSSPF